MKYNTSFVPESDKIPIETHPWQPFIPDNARVLIMGTFPPAPSRWAMPFYYPNRINDFWRIMGIVFYGNPERFYDSLSKQFRLNDIISFLTERGIALSDTGRRVQRLRNNASDAFLKIVEAVDLQKLLPLLPDCRAIATTGTLAAEVIAGLTSTKVPAIGSCVEAPLLTNAHNERIMLWRMPSTSRAYPLPVQRKAEAYATLFQSIGLL
ncbi:MAG: uracil-DNA glycosylase family protein [Bacteroides sp.]|nr:uracil-DNA glycosylase family protein [Bacteroides sp.]